MNHQLAYNTWGKEEEEAIKRVVESKQYTMGPYVKKFEKEFACKYGAQYAVMVNSGSSANLISVASLFYKKDRPLNRGDEVIVPAVSWSTTYFPLVQYGLKLKFIDIDLESHNMDVSLIEQAITPQTRAIMAVNILGNPCELFKIKDICQKHHLYFIEDNCESMHAKVDDQYCGTFGDLGTFSFFFSHHISTMEGGMILTNDKEIYHLCLSLRAHGWTRDLPEKNMIYQKSKDEFFEAYQFILPGYNVRPLEMSAAVGIEQLKKVDSMIAQRRKNARYFYETFKNNENFFIQKEYGESSWFSFTLTPYQHVNISRKAIFNALKENNIQFRIVTGGNILKHNVIKYFDYEIYNNQTPNADYLHDHGFFIGNAPFDMRNNIDHLYQSLKDF